MHEEWYNVDTWGGRKFPNTSNKECRSVMIQLKWANNLEDCYRKIDFSQLININTFYDNFEKRNIGISSPATRYHQ